MVVADAVLRKLPGALGDERSAVEESFSEALGGAPSTRTTRDRPNGAGEQCRRSCSPGTTSGSRSGGASRAGAGPPTPRRAAAPSRYDRPPSADRAVRALLAQ